MPGNAEEKEKCLEKLTKMQKFIPFLDFMIDKIKKKNNELSLDCQLSKFQVLRSMIAEKNGKYNWDNIIKVEDVIEKLIAKLDFKDQYEKPKENLDKKDSQNYKTSMATSVSLVPSSTVTTTTSQPKESKPQEFSSNTVDLIMKTLKISVESGMKQNTDRLSNPIGPNQSHDTKKAMETDLDKDLGGFDLTDCSNLSEVDISQSAAEPVSEVPEKPSSHDDLLSSSREKLLKSLQSRLLPCKTNRLSSQFSAASDKIQKSSDSQNSSAFARSLITIGEQKNKSDSENNEQKAVDKHNRKVCEGSNKSLAKQGILKSVIPSEKTRTDTANSSSDVNLKQRLKEKFSTDICEVYRVPGKSVGGSLRSLKESKDHKKSFNVEEDDLSKSGKVLHKGSTSHVSQTSFLHPKKNNQSVKSRRNSSTSEKSKEKTTHKHNSEKNEKRNDSKNSTSSRDNLKIRSQKSELGKIDKAPDKKSDGKNVKEGKKMGQKNFESDKLNDEELLGFVKENIKSLPHLSTLKPSELRKAVQSSLSRSFSQLDSDAVSEISDDSFQDLDDEIITEQKSEISDDLQGKEKMQHPLAGVKIAQIGLDGVAKNVKPIVEPTKDAKILDEIGDKMDDLDDVSCEENLEEEDYAIQLIEETTPNTYSFKKKKGLLELPMPVTNDLFDDISSFESFEPSDASPAESRDLRLKKLPLPSEGKNNSCNKTESNPDLSKTVGWHNLNIPKDSSHFSKSQTGFGCVSASSDNYKTQRKNQEKPDPRLIKPVTSHMPQDGTQHPQIGNRYPNESTEYTFRNSSSYSKSSVNHSRDPRRHSYSSEPKSYAEYKRLKRKEQEKLQHLSKESCKSTSDISNPPEPSRLPTDKEDTDRHAKKNQDFRHKGQNNSTSHTSVRTYESRRNSSNPNQRRYSDHSDSRSREERRIHNEETKKEESRKDEKRHSLDSEELVSPLEELYRNENKPKTGRGYGIQNFKIPKKVPQGSTKPSQVPSVKSATKPQNDTENVKKNVETKDSDKSEASQMQSTKEGDHSKPDVTQADASVGEHKTYKTEFNMKTDLSITKNEISNEKTTTKKLENSSVPANCRTPMKLEDETEGVAEVKPGTDTNKTDTLLEVAKAETKAQGVTYYKDVESSKKCEAQVVECDSSIESSSVHETSSKKEHATSAGKAPVVQKEEITQEFVEALIRKSFQSGEGKLLLAQVKLFEEFTRKLNSKKRKTIQKIQKIINSESGSSSSSEVSSDVEKKKKKIKKAEPKIKKQKKRGRKINKHKFSSSSSLSSCSYSSSHSCSVSSESEETNAAEIEGKRKSKRGIKTDETKDKESSPLPKTRTQKKRKDLELGKQFVGGRSKRQKIQKKLLEHILNEPQKKEDDSNSFSKDLEPTKRKAKSKTKTELDRLHDDIRSMFISDGVLTATGHRMCRILKESGGNMNNLDIVKESAKMVEEEKLKRGKTGKFRRNFSAAETERRSRSQSLDKGSKARETDEGDSKLKLEPRVVLQRVDLDNFGYGVKVSEECISFKRMQGRNTAIRGISSVVGSCKAKSYSPVTDGPVADGPAADGLATDGPPADGPAADGPAADGPAADGPAADGPAADGPAADGPAADSTAADSTVADGPAEDGPAEDGPAVDSTTEDGPGADSPAAHSSVADSSVADSSVADSSAADSVARNVFLLRNKRKFERLRDSHRKKSYHRKKLMDVVKNLPLKMAKMKHLQISEKKMDGEVAKKKKSFPEKIAKTIPQRQKKVEISNSELLNYAFEKKRRIYPCKLCPFSTKSITGHYRAVHPEHEVLISRLCVNEAEQAKKESEKFNYDSKAADLTPLSSESAKRKAKKFRHPDGYNCRMCPLTKVGDINTFASHVSSHTGEFRFQCPAEGCLVHVFSREQVKFHILTKHSKSRYEFYSKIKELYPLVVENGIMFGFLCSQCHYVQIGQENLENHMLRQHENLGEIIKINMSSEKVGKKRGKTKNGSKEESVCGNNGEEEIREGEDETEKMKEVDEENQEVQKAVSKKVDVKPVSKKRKHESSGSESDIEFVESKKIFLDKKAEVKEESKKPEITEKCDVRLDEDDVEEEDEEENEDDIDDDGAGNNGGDNDDNDDDDDDDDDEDDDDDDEDDDDDDEGENAEDNLCGDIDMEDCVDLKSISALKGSDIIDSVEKLEMKELPVKNTPETLEKLKVGPLEAVLLENSEVLYECFIKGCLFSTRVFDLFEKHIKISHRKTKWDGICEICGNKKEKPPKENSFQLLTALKHLKLHERERTSNGKLSNEDLIMELKLLNTSGERVVDDEESDDSTEGEPKIDSEFKQDEQSQEKTDSETPFPLKPLLRVRNLLGDRLSTPKADENEVVAINKEESSNAETPGDSSMFTIENVRSLTEEAPTEENELKIEKVCSLKNLILKPAPQLSSGKTIIVRSCPTRKIAIRPEPSSLSVDVGQISVVQPPVVAHPVVLSPISTTSPIRIISTTLSPKPQYTVKPVVLAADTVHLSNPNVIPVIRPSLTPTVAATTIIPVNTNVETIAVPHKPSSHENKSTEMENTTSNPSPDVEIIPSSGSKSPSVHLLPRSPSSDLEEEDEDAISPQKFFPSANTGKKSVKDARIYHEMLTKTKLCHLFKCMGIECSFTCSSESVFTQHIGLHEAQRRLKRNKGLKTIVLKSANKKTRAFYWQQCAYCCEVLTSSNKALGHHIYDEHGHCMYQCGFCFYRAICQSYVEIHQNLAHSQVLKTTSRVIYKCKPLKMPPSQAAAMEKHGKKQSVRPYQCDQCGKKFLITHEFTSHLASQHQSVTAYTCHICKNLCFKVNRLINHYKMHSYSTYQCAFCLHGTETEKEMVFHLCNFHFSQPAVMYVRALAEGQSDEERQKANKKEKKHLSNQLDSLKVIVYESDIGSSDCIVEAESEEISENASETSLDLSAIVAELGIYTGSQSTSTGVTPLMKELASIGDKTNKHLSVKNLLPNAQFSSENESGTENCSVLISSGLSIPSDPNNEREMNIPLGQLPLETVNVQHKKTPPPLSNSAGSPDKNLNINLVNLVNFQPKDKTVASTEEEKIGQSSTVVVSSAVHKLPPVVLGRSSTMKNAYPSKNVVAKKKSEESMQSNENTGDKKSNNEGKKSSLNEKAQKVPTEENTSRKPSTENTPEAASAEQPLITNVVSLSNDKYEKKSCGTIDESIIISDVCSLSFNSKHLSEVAVNVKSKGNSSPALKPPIIRVEDFHIDEENSTSKETSSVFQQRDSAKDTDRDSRTPEENRPSSPDIIILEDDKVNHIETVTLDSDDEKVENRKKEKNVDLKNVKDVSSPENETIRKEMEVLRNQITSETNSLLLEEVQTPEAEGKNPTRDLTLDLELKKNEEVPNSKVLFSPIEEAICSLNKKLDAETKEAQKKEEEEEEEEEEKKEVVEGPKEAEVRTSERRRTRFGARENRKDDKNKKFKVELTGKELFICGNEKCNFAGDDDSTLKDHLYVCDLSRESSVLMCPHCSRQIKQFHPYLEHLKYHGVKKYHCGLCEFSSAVDASVSRHVKQKHKCTVIKVLPKESMEGHLVYYPKNYKVEKIDFEVNGYSPGDEDKLPLQSVYQVNVKCAKCPYFTKVRSNMVRHLKIHVKSVETEGVVVVPSTAPTNPVPCLETKERMFDKMTNLAASSQLAQAKEKTALESLSPEEEAKLPQFVAEQMRYKCCLPDCNYITVDDGMLKHHIKALHDEINYYSCPHCRSTVHVDVRHVTLDKIGFHLKHHDSKLYKCAHCIFFHYQKSVVEKHTIEKHPDRRYFVHTVREPKLEPATEEEPSSGEGGARVWKCGLCDDCQTPSKSTLMDHLLKSHNTKSKYKCQLCSMKGNTYQVINNHFASKHVGEKVSYLKMYYSDKVSGTLESGNSSGADSSNEHFDTTPLWQRGAPRVRHIRGILIEEEEIKTKKSKKAIPDETEAETSDAGKVNENAFYCPLCTNKKKPFYTRNEDCFRTHLYQELNYQQFACILCGKMFVDRKDFEKHHAKAHADKPQSFKQTKEDHEIKFWVDQVIAKRKTQMEERKRKLSDSEGNGSQEPPKKKKEG